MTRAETYAALAPLVTAQLRRGVRTNCFLSADDYRRECALGLWYEETDGGLFLFRQRPGYLILNFYLQPEAKPRLPQLSQPVVTELACREKDRAAMQQAEQTLLSAGFVRQFSRLRRTRQAVLPPEATAEQVPSGWAVRDFLLAHFDPLTGCIPSDAVLQTEIQSGHVLCLTDVQGIAGLLHYAPGRAACEIRHLAVREDCRGQGNAQKLLRQMTAATGGQKCIVWARQGNTPAENFYEKNNFQPDGWTSVVLRLG